MDDTSLTNKQLVDFTIQLEKDWKRLYPNGDTNNPLYERLEYRRYLCKERVLSIPSE